MSRRDTVRLVCPEDSCKVQSGLAAGCRCYESGCACDLSVTRSGFLIQNFDYASRTPVITALQRRLVVRIIASHVSRIAGRAVCVKTKGFTNSSSGSSRAQGGSRQASTEGAETCDSGEPTHARQALPAHRELSRYWTTGMGGLQLIGVQLTHHSLHQHIRASSLRSDHSL